MRNGIFRYDRLVSDQANCRSDQNSDKLKYKTSIVLKYVCIYVFLKKLTM